MWHQEINELNVKSVTTPRDWIASGKPRAGVIFNQQQTDKYAYKSRIHESKTQEQISYSNDRVFSNKVDGTTNEKEIVSKFADYFRTCCCANCAIRGAKLRNDYENKRRDYKGSCFGDAQPMDAELIDSVLSRC